MEAMPTYREYADTRLTYSSSPYVATYASPPRSTFAITAVKLVTPAFIHGDPGNIIIKVSNESAKTIATTTESDDSINKRTSGHTPCKERCPSGCKPTVSGISDSLSVRDQLRHRCGSHYGPRDDIAYRVEFWLAHYFPWIWFQSQHNKCYDYSLRETHFLLLVIGKDRAGGSAKYGR